MYVPRERYSLTMSFCVVPRRAAGYALLRGVGDVQRQQPRRGGVDRHRRVHLPRRDAVEQRAHVAEVADGDADLAHLAPRHRRVGVVAGLRRQVEGDRQAGLALGEVRAVQLVRRRGGRVPRVGAHHPRPVGRVRSVLPGSPVRPLRTAWRAGRGTAPGDSDRAQRGEVRRRPLHVEQPPVSRSHSTRATSATFDASWRCGTSIPRRRTPRCARRTARRPARRRRLALDRVGPAEPVQAVVRPHERRRDPAARPARIGAAHHDVGERGVPAHVEAAQLRRSERMTRRPSSGMIARGSGENQAIRLRPNGIGNSPLR